MRQWKHIITEEEDDKALGEILKACGFSKKQISRQKFLSEGITVDGRKCRISQRVKTGQALVLNFEEASEKYVFAGADQEFLDMPEILYEDEALLVVNKPSGLSSVVCRNLKSVAAGRMSVTVGKN